MNKCPRQEQRDWTPGDYYDVDCPDCGQTLEFFKQEEKRKCGKCGQMVLNPKYEKQK